MKVGILGATGLVGRSFLDLLSKGSYPITELRLFSRSEKEMHFRSQKLRTEKPSEKGFQGLDLCFFSAGGGGKPDLG